MLDLNVDAIVNAANTSLNHSGGLASAIVSRGGWSIQEESNRVGTCELGSAVATAAGALSAKYIIHVPTVNYPLQRASLAQIEEGVRSALRLAESLRIKKIAFPLLGTGIAGLQVRPVVLVMLAVFAEFADLDITLAVHWQDDIMLVRQLAERAGLS